MLSDPRVLVVTGGSRGIGAEVVSQAAAEGWVVCLSYEGSRAEAEDLAARVEAVGGRARAVRADIANEADVITLFQAAAELGQVRGLVANAAVVAPPSALRDFTAERVRRILDVNVLGTVLCCREAVQHMAPDKHDGEGAIVLVSSAASRIGSAFEYVDYAASKGAIDSLGLGLAREVAADGIRVNVVRPGTTATEIHQRNGQPDRLRDAAGSIPLGRVADATEIAAAIVWLLSDGASYCTGSILDVAGGR